MVREIHMSKLIKEVNNMTKSQYTGRSPPKTYKN